MKYKCVIVFFSLLFQLSLFGQDSPQSLVHALDALPNDTSKVSQLLKIGIAYQSENADSATFYLNQASELAEQLEAAEKISEAYLQQGIHFIQIGRFTAADSL
ncbi:MAG: hypothetical protein AB8G22_06585, partial [Saprospiraceae bacterium]